MQASNTDDKKLQSQLKKLSINPIPGIEEVNMFKDDGSVIHFTNPKVFEPLFHYVANLISQFIELLSW